MLRFLSATDLSLLASLRIPFLLVDLEEDPDAWLATSSSREDKGVPSTKLSSLSITSWAALASFILFISGGSENLSSPDNKEPSAGLLLRLKLRSPPPVVVWLLLASPEQSDSLLGCADVALLEVIDKLSAEWQLRWLMGVTTLELANNESALEILSSWCSGWWNAMSFHLLSWVVSKNEKLFNLQLTNWFLSAARFLVKPSGPWNWELNTKKFKTNKKI